MCGTEGVGVICNVWRLGRGGFISFFEAVVEEYAEQDKNDSSQGTTDGAANYSRV